MEKQKKAKNCFRKLYRKRLQGTIEEKNRGVNMAMVEKNSIQEFMNIEDSFFEESELKRENEVPIRDVKGKKSRLIIASKKSLCLYEVPVLKIKVMDHTENHVKNINAIIDTGAQVSIIEQQLVNELNWDVPNHLRYRTT